jgi:hypothetical protein
MNEHIREGRGSIPGLFAQPKKPGLGRTSTQAPPHATPPTPPTATIAWPEYLIQAASAVVHLSNPCGNPYVVAQFQRAWNAYLGSSGVLTLGSSQNAYISVDGVYGQETYAAISKVIVSPPRPCPEVTTVLPNNPIKAVGRRPNGYGMGDWLDAVRRSGMGLDSRYGTTNATPQGAWFEVNKTGSLVTPSGQQAFTLPTSVVPAPIPPGSPQPGPLTASTYPTPVGRTPVYNPAANAWFARANGKLVKWVPSHSRGLGDTSTDPTTMDPTAGGSSYPGEITQTGVSTPVGSDPSTDPGSSAPVVVQSPSAPVTSTTTTTYPPVIPQTGTSTPVESSSKPAATDNTSIYVAAGGIAAAAGLWWWLSHRKR